MKKRYRRNPPSVDHYPVVADLEVGGANEKDILEDPDTGDWYIAKLGKRNSDLEVVTEYIIHLIGRHLGAHVAEGKVAMFRGQLRYLSKYFIDRKNDEELVHGIQLFRALYDDSEVDAVLGDHSREQGMFSLQQIEAAFGAHYVDYGAATGGRSRTRSRPSTSRRWAPRTSSSARTWARPATLLSPTDSRCWSPGSWPRASPRTRSASWAARCPARSSWAELWHRLL